MCSVIYNLTDYSILICPRESMREFNATATTFAPNATTATPNTTTAIPNTTTATPNTSPNTTDIHNTSSTTKDTINTSMPVCAPCTCHEVTVPSPSIDIVGNFSNNTHRHGLGSSVVQDLSWLHAFWAFVPLVAILCYCRIRKKICARMRVGFIKERYTRRSKSWPTHERAEHPARVPRSKSSFDTVVL